MCNLYTRACTRVHLGTGFRLSVPGREIKFDDDGFFLLTTMGKVHAVYSTRFAYDWRTIGEA